MDELLQYKLIGIGEFSHGIKESWLFRFKLLKSFDNKLISFSNSSYKNNKYGVQSYDKSNKWNYILFWNKVTRLEPIYNY